MKIGEYTVKARPPQYDVDDIEDFLRRHSFIDQHDPEDEIEEKLSLKHLKRKLVAESQLTLTDLDERIIERIWTKIALEYWLTYAVSKWTNFMKNCEDNTVMQKHLESLGTEDFWSISILQRHPLQRILNETKQLFDKDSLTKCLQSYKDQCLSQMLEQTRSIALEIQFLSEFIRVLKETADTDFIFAYRTEILCLSTDPQKKFRKLLEKVVETNRSGNHLTSVAEALRNEKEYYLANNFFATIMKFFEPLHMKMYKANGIVIGQVSGSAYSLSEILELDETTIESDEGLQIEEIEEIHLIGQVSINIDTDLRRPGVNVVIKTARLTTYNNAVIDVSGENSKNEYSSDAGSGWLCGNDGKDGFAGESAGNVWIEAENIVSCPTIIANGGNGSNGQNGGHGKDGKDGEGMTKNKLEELFPPAAAYLLPERSRRVQKIIDNIDCNLDTVLEAWYTGEDASSWNSVWENIKKKRNGKVLGIQTHTLYQNQSLYLRVKLKSEKIVIFAFECGGHFSWTNCQSYLLVEGTEGTSGDRGGLGGRGGKGGFAGSITVNGEVRSGNAGVDGSNGRRGLHGYNGKNGWDIGWLDYSVSGAFGADTWPKFYGGGENLKLELDPFKDSNSDRIFCPYRNSQNYERCMMEMKTKQLEHPKQRETSTVCTKQGNIEHHAVATRKNNVQIELARNQYSDNFSVVNQILTTIHRNHQSTCDVVNATIMLGRQEDEMKTDTKVLHQVEFTNQPHKHTTYTARPLPLLGIESTKPLWTNTRQNYLVKVFESLRKTEISVDMINNIIPPHSCNIDQDSFIAKYDGISSTNFCSFIQFFEAKEAPELANGFKRLCKERKQNDKKSGKDDNTYLRVVRQFVLDIGSTTTEKAIKDLVDKYQLWLSKAEKNLIVFEESITPIDEKCFNNKHIMKKFDKHLQMKPSIKSNSHMELFAQLSEVRLEVYREDELGNIVHDKTFNSTAHEKLQIFANSEGQINEELRIDYPYFQFVQRQQQKSMVYGSILNEILRFTTAQEVENYVRRKRFTFTEPLVAKDYKAFAEQFDVKQAILDVEAIVPDDTFSMCRLNFITESYIGTNRILKALRDRLCSEGGRISSTELCFLVNTTLRLTTKTDYSENIILWIITAHDQQEWTLEFCILQLENYFHRSFPENVKENLRTLDDKQVLLLLIQKLHEAINVTMEDTINIINSIQKTTTASALVELSLTEWPYALRLGYWTDRLQKVAEWEKEEDVERITQYLPTMESVFSETLLEKLFDVFDKQQSLLTSTAMLAIFRGFFTEQYFLNDEFIAWLEHHPAHTWLSKLAIGSSNTRSLSDLVHIILNNSKISVAAKSKLTTVVDVINRATSAAELFASFNQDDVLNWSKSAQLSKKSLDETLAVIDRAIFLKDNFSLRDTQKLAIVMFLEGKEENRILEQVSTGEGKSLIVVSIAIIKALRGEKVDVITSSTVLARRDAESSVGLFAMFGLNVSHNCSESLADRIDVYGKNEVVYGELSNFQRDYLLDRFYGKNIFGNRNFQNLIVDEVDSMLLDKGNNVLYLSHQIPGFDKLEVVFLYIWQLVNRPVKSQQEYDNFLNAEYLRDNVMDNLCKRITSHDLKQIATDESSSGIEEQWKELINNKLIDESGRLLVRRIDDNSIDRLITFETKEKKRLIFLLREVLRKECLAEIPNFLLSFVENHLTRWIENAKNALLMIVGNDYVVDIDRTGTRHDLHANITILDRDTGTDQASSQWEEGLHQFLQLKHGCRLSLMSLKAVFISNVSYFKLYKNLFGLTGTLGSQVEMDLLQRTHGVDYVTIPTSCGKLFEEETPVICTNISQWMKRIEEEIRTVCQKQQRSVLVICETIENVNYVQKELVTRGIADVFAYRREHEHFSVADKPLMIGQVIVATNLAGRGTDIKISNVLRENGGLHVCLTYLPSNKRVEEQAFGRAARSGDPGTGRLIVLNAFDENMAGIRMIVMKKDRDYEEIKRVSTVKQNYEEKILAEEYCFEEFQKVYKTLQNRLKSEGASTNLLENLIDQWAFWLDKSRQIIRNDANSRKYKDELSKFVTEYSEFPISHKKLLMSHAIVQGKTCFETKAYKEAIKLFNEVIRNEPEFCEAAHYYKAYAISKTFNWEISNKALVKKVKDKLRTAKRMLERRCDIALQCSAIVNRMKDNFRIRGVVQIHSYEQQKQSLVRMYEHFITSIDDAIGTRVTSKSFVAGVIDQQMGEILYDKLMEKRVLRQMQLRKSFEDSILNDICSNYGADHNATRSILEKQNRKECDQNQIVEMLTKHILLPNRDDFWNELIDQKFLINPVTYVIADETTLVEEFPLIFRKTEKLAQIRIPNFKERIESSTSVMVKTVEQVIELCPTKAVFNLEFFKNLLGNLDYNILVRKQLVTEIDVADINEEFKTIQFEKFDQLQTSDFHYEYIDPEEVEVILKRLVDMKLITESNSGYNLNGDIHEIRTFSFCDRLNIYENAVRSIIQRSFAYRLAFNRLQVQMADESWPIKIPVTHKPHQGLFWDLVDAAIISPAVVRKDVNGKEIIENYFSENISHENLAKSLEKEVPNIKKERSIQLLVKAENLIKKTCKGHNQTYSITDKAVSVYVNEPLNRKINSYLRSEMLLRKETTKSAVVGMLDTLKGFITALEAAEPYLQTISEAVGSQCNEAIQEINIFTMNGLGDLIRFKEKPWTIKMIFNTSLVVALGLCQLAIGVGIQLFSVGLMTNAGVGFISEGVGDLMFAVSAFRSGYFNWSSYWQHKKESLMITVVTCGVGALCSRGAQVSRYGAKLAEKSLEVGGRSVSNMCGMELIKEFGWNAVGKQVLRDVSLNTLKGVTFGITSAEVTKFVDHHLRSLCDGMAATFMVTVKETVAKHTISQTIETVYERLGPTEGKHLIENWIESALLDLNSENTMATKFYQFGSSVARGISEGLKKRNQAGATISQNLPYIVFILGKCIDGARKAQIIGDLAVMVKKFLDKLDGFLQKSSAVTTSKNAQIFDDEKERTEFRKTAVATIVTRLQTQTGKTIAKNFVDPILQLGATHLVTYVGQQIKKQYNSSRDNYHSEKLDEEQKRYRENAKAARERGADAVTINAIDDDHRKILLDIMKTARDPKLYARIVRDGGHMDMVCLKACAALLDEKLRAEGNTKGYRLVIKGEQEVTYTCYCGNTENAETVNVKLSSTHFELLDDNLVPISKPNTDYNCMFESLQGRIPELDNETTHSFRESVAQRIESDPHIGTIIRQGLQGAALHRGLYGGKKLTPSPKIKNGFEHRQTHIFEHSEYRFQAAYDVNLKNEREVESYNDPEAREQLKKAYETALKKCNECLSAYANNDGLRSARGKLENINSSEVMNSIENVLSNNETPVSTTVTDPDFIPISFVERTTENGNKVNVCVEWEATVNQTVSLDRSGKKHSTNFEFKLNINVDNPGKDESGPRAPHIGYSVRVSNKPIGCPQFRTISGHVILDSMRDLPGRTKFGMKTYDEVRRETGSYTVTDNWLTTKVKPRRSKSLSR